MATKRSRCSLRVGDRVIVIAGGNSKKRSIKGKVGTIRSIVGDRVTIEGVNQVVRYRKPRKIGDKGGPATVDVDMHISNVMFYDEKNKKGVRLCSRTLGDGTKVRGYMDKKSFVQIASK